MSVKVAVVPDEDGPTCVYIENADIQLVIYVNADGTWGYADDRGPEIGL